MRRQAEDFAAGSKRMKRAGCVRIGISGWTYPPWRGVFFPVKLPHKHELEYAADIFHTIEINGRFYSLQRPSSYQNWVQRTPKISSSP
jgi:uncharacterized protein YecE (DUF72 family)